MIIDFENVQVRYYNLCWYCLVFTVFFQTAMSCDCFCYHYFDHFDYQHNINVNSPVMIFLNAPSLLLHSFEILPRLLFQILSELAEILQRMFLQFFCYNVNYELLLKASYVLYSHTNIPLTYQCQFQQAVYQLLKYCFCQTLVSQCYFGGWSWCCQMSLEQLESPVILVLKLSLFTKSTGAEKSKLKFETVLPVSMFQAK